MDRGLAPQSLFEPHANEKLRNYLETGLETIEGWSVDRHISPLFLAIDRFHELNSEVGHLFEIGVHHGRSAVLMALLAKPQEQAVLLDLFDRRIGAGPASRALLERNLARWAPGLPVVIDQGDSREVDFRTIAKLSSGVRLAHIDGGCDRETVLNDLLKIEEILSPRGVVIAENLDHPDLSGAREGLETYLDTPGNARLTPVAYGRNKLVLTTRSNSERLRVFLLDGFASGGCMLDGEVEFHGHRALRLKPVEFPVRPARLRSAEEALLTELRPQALQGRRIPGSTVCRYEHFTQDWYARWAKRLRIQNIEVTPQNQLSHRKAWEWAAILQALEERGMLQPGRRAMGFAVGTEQLASMFAGMGIEVLASDMSLGEAAEGWAATGQHAASLQALFHPHQVDDATFNRLVSFKPVDMKDLSDLPRGAFDFIWSSCAIEHLGTLELGLDFVCEAMHLLKPGGIAVHTTEYNVSSNENTVAVGDNCIYRRRDLEALDHRLRAMRCGLEALDFDAGTHRYDLDYDAPPYFTGRHVHLKLQIAGFVCTSFLLIAHKGA